MRTIYHELAWLELVEAYEWHEGLGESLGASFAAAMHAALTDIANSPLRFPLYAWKARRCLVLQFRFAIVYEIKSDHVYIIAIMHTSRFPGYWRSRVPKK